MSELEILPWRRQVLKGSCSRLIMNYITSVSHLQRHPAYKTFSGILLLFFGQQSLKINLMNT